MKTVFSLRQAGLLLGCFAMFTVGTRQANAGFVFFNIPGLHPGESARVAEQIVCANVLCTGLDYQFYVMNTGVRPIDGVSFGLGVVNAGAQIAGGVLTGASRPGGGDGPFPNVAAGFFGGTQVLGIPAGAGVYATGPAPWGFEEWQDAGTAGLLPATFYIVRWYSPIQGPFAARLMPGRIARMDLFTVFGPAGGSGAVDPPDISLPYFGFETTDGDLSTLTGQTLLDAWDTPCDPEHATCSAPLNDPYADSTFSTGTFQDDQAFADLVAPEPGSMLLLAGGALGLLLRSRRAA